MGSQHSAVNRTKSLDVPQSTSHQQFADGNEPSSSSSTVPFLPKRGHDEEVDGKYSTTSTVNDRPRIAQRSHSTLVVVNKVTQPAIPRIEDDPLFKKWQEIPAFMPLMYEAENNTNLFGKNKALEEIRSKVDPTSFIQIVRLYEEKLRRHGESVNSEQRRLAKCIREIDQNSSKLYKAVNERDRKFTRTVGKLQRLNDVTNLTHALSKCQMVMYECEQHVQILNGLLPFDERLEPYEPLLKLDR